MAGGISDEQINPFNSVDRISEEKKLRRAAKEFSEEMISKLIAKTGDGRRGWDDPEWTLEQIKKDLIKHVEKGDFVDVANYAMFAFFRP